MNREELLQGAQNSEHYYRVTINGNFKDLKTFKGVLEYIKSAWNEDSSYCSIKLVAFINKNGGS
jgi:hypothetical protein